jgi:hypothetical protein
VLHVQRQCGSMHLYARCFWQLTQITPLSSLVSWVSEHGKSRNKLEWNYTVDHLRDVVVVVLTSFWHCEGQ